MFIAFLAVLAGSAGNAMAEGEAPIEVNAPSDVGPAPGLKSLNRQKQRGGSTIVLTGENFGPASKASRVTVGGKLMPAEQWSGTRIVGRVPRGTAPGRQSIIVRTQGGTSSTRYLTVLPRVEELVPDAEQTPAVAELKGSNFGARKTNDEVLVDGRVADILNWSNESITFQVPAELKAAWHDVELLAGGTRQLVGQFGTVAVITALDADAGIGGEVLKLKGIHFGRQVADSVIYVGDVTAPIVSWDRNEVAIRIPESLVAGRHSIQPIVDEAPGNVLSLRVRPQIRQLATGTAGEGMALQVLGSNFSGSAASDHVHLGDDRLSLLQTSPRAMIASLPYGLPAGQYPFYVSVNGERSNWLVVEVPDGPRPVEYGNDARWDTLEIDETGW